jgi:hypothetical protein
MAKHIENDIAPEVGLTLEELYNIDLNEIEVRKVTRIRNRVHITLVASDKKLKELAALGASKEQVVDFEDVLSGKPRHFDLV